jgi:hypothetical protein
MNRDSRDFMFIGVVLTLLFYGFTKVWWASEVNSRVAYIEKWVENNRTMPETIVRMETRFDGLGEKMDELKAQLERVDYRFDRLEKIVLKSGWNGSGPR